MYKNEEVIQDYHNVFFLPVLQLSPFFSILMPKLNIGSIIFSLSNCISHRHVSRGK